MQGVTKNGLPPGSVSGQSRSARFACTAKRSPMTEGDGREQRVLDHILATTPPNNPAAVVAAIDEFAYNKSWMMNVGDVKGAIVDKAILDCNPKVLLELGTYCGYSATRFASLLKTAGAKLYTVDKSEYNAQIARRVLSHAGLLDTKVDSIVGILGTSIQALRERGVTTFDFVFLDHWKEAYLPDLKLLIEEGFLHKGTVVVADNVLWPGAPDYRKFMQDSKVFDTVEHETTVEYSDTADLVLVSTYKGKGEA
ncbi:hypothetical protein WJX72_000971 [[Myrmecia] bisecta]|uniref:catechol O-methyltransferase n=1 Tax=[Myrmecia] bisecta TaxID=41462 RepID=A0AAW1PFB3_9CHLO